MIWLLRLSSCWHCVSGWYRLKIKIMFINIARWPSIWILHANSWSLDCIHTQVAVSMNCQSYNFWNSSSIYFHDSGINLHVYNTKNDVKGKPLLIFTLLLTTLQLEAILELLRLFSVMERWLTLQAYHCDWIQIWCYSKSLRDLQHSYICRWIYCLYRWCLVIISSR